MARFSQKATAAVIVAGLALFAAPGRVLGQGQATYKVKHEFNFKTGGNVVPVAAHKYENRAEARPPGGVFVNNGVVNMTGGGMSDHTAQSVGPKSEAFSHTNATIPAYGVGGPVKGSIQADGFAVAGGGFAQADSYSAVAVFGGQQMRNGQIVWGPRLFAEAAGNARVGKRDPIDFSVLDLVTHDTLTGTLLDIGGNLGRGGSFSLDQEMFTLSGGVDFDFHIDITSPYTVEQGTLDLEVESGLVTMSTATGMFASLGLPSLGSGGTFSFALPDITLDYNLGDFSGHDLDITFGFGGGGSAQARGIPEPSALALMGLGGLGMWVGARRRKGMRWAARLSGGAKIGPGLEDPFRDN